MPSSPIPFLDFSGAGSDLLLLHANGYPPACYRPLISRLTKTNRVIAMEQRPLWKDSRPDEIRDWSPFTEDLLRFLDENKFDNPLTVVGHSLGGVVALRAALKEPRRFQRLILLDPVLLPPFFIFLWNISLIFHFAHRLHPHLVSASKRRREFADLELVFKSYRLRSTFRFMDDEALREYIAGITSPKDDGGYRLRYSPEWETRVYYASIWNDMDIWRSIKKFTVPTLIVRGAETDTFWEMTARKTARLNPSIRIETVEKATHLVPLERPQETFDIINTFLNP